MMTGLQCEKALYLAVHSPELAGEVSGAQQMMFDQGHEVGREAQKRFPGGVLIDAPHTAQRLALEQTKAAIDGSALNIYEATFQYSDVLVKVDILTRASVKAPWEIVEVKSSTSVKPVQIPDAAIQLWVLRSAGLSVKSASIMHLNNECTYPDLENLFTRVDVTTESEALQEEIPEAAARFLRMLEAAAASDVDIGPHCDDPYECAFKEYCWAGKGVPDVSMFNVPRLGAKRKWELYRKGVVHLSDLDVDKCRPIQRRMIECSIEGKQFVDAKAIRSGIAEWAYPLAFLDFETMGYAIPRFGGMRPYEQLPFQFSCHIQTESGANPEHVEYLHPDGSDPRASVAQALVECVSESGSVVAYNMGFERGVLRHLADEVPVHREALNSIADRLVDPLPLFRAYVYAPGFAGSFSIKAVAPAILGESASYEGMEVGEGAEAQASFLEMIRRGTEPDRKAELRQALLDYCRKDTGGMMDLVFWLQKQ
jgi:hypothetical protein